MNRNTSSNSVHGILLVDKPIGQSSNRTLQDVKSIFNAKKAGHTGNLDVLAGGLLPVCFGEATKISQFLLDSDKRYNAEFTFGKTTSTGDGEGDETSSADISQIGETALNAAIEKLTGDILQIPPMHSALKINGKRLYRLARAGVEVERKARSVSIYSFELKKMDFPKVAVHVHCSKGTYIRVLAEDLGRILGCGAYLSKLQRVSSGPFELADSHSISYLKKIFNVGGQGGLKGLLLKADRALLHLPEVSLSRFDTRSLKLGQKVMLEKGWSLGENIRLYDETDNFFGIGEINEQGILSSKRLFNL